MISFVVGNVFLFLANLLCRAYWKVEKVVLVRENNSRVDFFSVIKVISCLFVFLEYNVEYITC